MRQKMKLAEKLTAEALKSDDPLVNDLGIYLNAAINLIKRYQSIQDIEEYITYKRLRYAGLRFLGYENTDRGYVGDITIYAHIPTNGELIEDAQPRLVKDLDFIYSGKRKNRLQSKNL